MVVPWMEAREPGSFHVQVPKEPSGEAGVWEMMGDYVSFPTCSPPRWPFRRAMHRKETMFLGGLDPMILFPPTPGFLSINKTC
jgi:hypothetical protein